MKNLLKTSVLAAALLIGAQTYAHPVQDTTKLSGKVKKGLTKAGHKTSELAAKGASAVVDKIYKGKAGPGGETIYINKHDHYYYINSKGHKVYLKKSQLVDKPAS